MKIPVFQLLFRFSVLAAMLASVQGSQQARAEDGLSDADREVVSRLVKVLSEESRGSRDHDRVTIDVDRDRDRERELEERRERDKREREEDRRRQEELRDRLLLDSLRRNPRSLSEVDDQSDVETAQVDDAALVRTLQLLINASRGSRVSNSSRGSRDAAESMRRDVDRERNRERELEARRERDREEREKDRSSDRPFYEGRVAGQRVEIDRSGGGVRVNDNLRIGVEKIRDSGGDRVERRGSTTIVERNPSSIGIGGSYRFGGSRALESGMDDLEQLETPRGVANEDADRDRAEPKLAGADSDTASQSTEIDIEVLSRALKLLSEESRGGRDHDRVQIDVDRDRDRERELEQRRERDKREREEDRVRQEELRDRLLLDNLRRNPRSLSEVDDQSDVETPKGDVSELSDPGSSVLDSTENATPELIDEAFGRYVNLDQVGTAIRSGDASSLVDIALQLAEGERILFRTHKSGVTSRSLFEKTIKLALDSANAETLDRLQRIFEKNDNKELISQLATSRKLGSETRAMEPGLTVSFDTTTPEQFHSIKEILNSIREAEILGDRESLQQIESAINASTEISDGHRDALLKRIKNRLEGIPASTYGKVDPISRLMGSSRGGLNINTIGGGVLSGKGSWVERPGDWGSGPIHTFKETTPAKFPNTKTFNLKKVTYRTDDGTVWSYEQMPNAKWGFFRSGQAQSYFNEIGRSSNRVILREEYHPGAPLHDIQLTMDRQLLFRRAATQEPWRQFTGVQKVWVE